MALKEKIKNFLKLLQKEVKNPVYIPIVYSDILVNKVIFITGGASGIGLAIAKQCLNNGASVILAGRNEERLKSAVAILKKQDLRNDQQVLSIQADVSNVNSIGSIIKEAVNLTIQKRIDVLINNAGVSAGATIGQTSEEDFNKVLETNLKGSYFMAQEFSNYLIKNNINGNILNVSSVSGVRPAISPYMISKWGINGLTKGLAKKLIKHGIVVNAIAPGPTTTDMLGKNNCDLSYNSSPSKRYIDPIEVANLAIFLVSDMGRMIVGDTVYITGGCGNLTLDDIYY